jgi:hypothetical protein
MNTSNGNTNWLGRHVIDREGNQLGRIRDIYQDKETGRAQWASVEGGLLGTSTYYIPLDSARIENADVQVDYDYNFIKSAPKIERDTAFDSRVSSELSDYYHSEAEDGIDDRVDVLDGAEPAVDLHKEEIDINTEQRPYAKARLHKYTVTKNQTITVPIVEEHAKLVFDNSQTPHSSGEHQFDDRDVEVVLNREEPVISKQVIHLGTARLQIEETRREVPVNAEVREEKVDLIDADDETVR